MEILRLEQLCYSYTGKKNALRDINITFNSSEKIALLGSNGAGKSTLFLNCNGVLHPDKGQRLLYGKAVTHKKADLMELRRQVGIVFQEPDRQFVAPTVEAEVSFGPMNLGLKMEEVRDIITETLDMLGLSALRFRAPHTLSGGEKKLVSIADVLAMKPKMIMLDEPTAGLDPYNTALLEDTLCRMYASGITLVVATHDVDFAWRWADRTVVMHKGKILADGKPEEIFRDEESIKKAGLIQPTYMRVAQLLGSHGIIPPNTYMPKTQEELAGIL